MTEVVDIAELFEKYYLYHCDIYIDNKLYRSGKFKMIAVKNHNIKLTLDTNDNLKPIDFSYPFDISEDNNVIVFNYKTDKIINNNPLLKNKINDLLKGKEPSIYFDSFLTFRFTEI